MNSRLAAVREKVAPAGARAAARSREAFAKAADTVNQLRSARFSLKDQALFAKRLAFLINAGVPIVEALEVLRSQMLGKRHAAIFEKVTSDVASGQSLSRSLGKFENIFGEFAVHIIRVGESSGTLSQNLTYLADELKKREALRRKIIGAFIYPAIISVATIGITIFLMVYLFPKITPIFSSLHASLPLPTRIVMALSGLLIHWGVLILLLIALLSFAFAYFVKRMPRLRIFIENSYLRLPIIGNMMRSYNLANGTRTLGLLLKSGVHFSEALDVTADTTSNLLYKDAYADLKDVVVRGERISTRLTANPALFPDVMIHMVVVGERSGTLSDTLVYLSEMYDGEVDDFTRNLSTLIEPVLMVFMGLVVGFIAVSIITPIYGITQSLHA